MDASDLPKALPADATDELYRLIADTIPQIVWSARTDGSGEFHNARASEYYGIEAARLAGEGWRAMVHPDDLPGCLAAWHKAVAGGTAFSFEYRLRRSDGMWRWHLSKALPLRDSGGSILRWFGTATDIEDQKRAAGKLESQIRQRTDELRKSEARLRGLADLWADWYWEQDDQFRFTLLSRDLERKAGLATSAALGKTRWELPTIGVSDAQWATHRADLAARRPFQDFEYRRQNAQGDLIWLSASGVPVFDDAGRFVGYHGIGRNITQRKRAEVALVESEARFRSLTSLSSDFYWETDVEHRLRLLEYGAKHKPLHPRQYLLGKTRWEVESIAPDEAGWNKHREVLEAHVPFRDFEFSRSRADGVVLHYSISGEPMYDPVGTFLGYRGVGRDVTERLRAERALHESERRIRALLRRLTATQEAERRRIAADLHDFVGQNLTALSIALETLRAATGNTREKPNLPTFEEMAGLLQDTMDSVRQTMSDLRPPLLDDYGLIAALESHARRFSARTGLAVSVENARIGARPAPNVELALFRIAQEALANAVKHASATSARVALTAKGGFLRLAVEDNGSGFAQPSGARAEHRGGWGLPMMRERAEEAGGTLRIEFPGRGTRVVAEVPYVDSNHPG
ncbi:MAG TPA: PAS domain S-box protein [Burkholderiales bacterium]|nr:PAS domain S-box protein [Burkholderiales bacterium]